MQTRLPIPESFRCPISGDLMVDPVVDREGNTYDRASIQEWLARNPTSPMTRTPMTKEDLKPNRALADSIAAFTPTLEIERAGEGVPHPQVAQALREEAIYRSDTTWLAKVRVLVVSGTGLPKADAIVVVSNGSSHLIELPQECGPNTGPDGPESLKKATPPSGGKEPVWNHEMHFPVAVLSGQDDARELVLHVKHLGLGKKWTGNNEGEWLGKATVRLAQIKEGATHELRLPLLKKGVPVGAAVLNLQVTAEEVSYESFAELVSREPSAACQARNSFLAGVQKGQELVGLLSKGLEILQVRALLFFFETATYAGAPTAA